MIYDIHIRTAYQAQILDKIPHLHRREHEFDIEKRVVQGSDTKTIADIAVFIPPKFEPDTKGLELKLEDILDDKSINLDTQGLCGYEIKSASDTLARLPKQLNDYKKVFDYLTVIVDGSYLEETLKIMNEYSKDFGLIYIDHRGEFITLRQTRKNNATNSKSQLNLLTRDELYFIVNTVLRIYSGDSKEELVETIIEYVDKEKISDMTATMLFHRKNNHKSIDKTNNIIERLKRGEF